MAQLKLLLLDFDGTLANTARANTLSYIDALAEEGYNLSEEEYRRRFFGVRCPEFLRAIGFTDAADIRRIRERKVELYPSHFDLVTLNVPLWNFVQDFRRTEGKAWIVSTGHPSNIRNVMRHLGIEGGVDGIVTGDEVAASKPSPDGFLRAMHAVGATPEETLIFEDSEVGLEAARRTGAAYIKVELEF